jgi:hypothetical protein
MIIKTNLKRLLVNNKKCYFSKETGLIKVKEWEEIKEVKEQKPCKN